MGCCHSHDKTDLDPSLTRLLQSSIQSNSREQLLQLLPRVQASPNLTLLLNSPIIQQKFTSLTPLAFALWEGHLDSFKTLLEDFSLSILEMEKNLSNYSYTSLSLICEKNFSDILEYFLPIFLNQNTNLPFACPSQKSTLNFELSATARVRNLGTPVHVACELGNISTLLTIFNFFKDKECVPYYLDLHYVDEASGENCALIACRKGNFAMIKFLKDVIKADFELKNAQGEDAVRVLLAGNKRSEGRNVFECLVYLVEEVGVGLGEGYEEMLLLAQDRNVVEYIEKKLGDIGVEVDKVVLERNYGIPVGFRSENEDEESVKNSNLFKGMNLDDTDRTALSTISYVEVTNESISLFGKSGFS